MSSAMLLAALLTLAFSIWSAIFLIWPAVGRAAFVREISQIRDEVDDAVIEGRLPDNESVRSFIDRADHYIANSGELSLSLLLAIHRVHQASNAELPSRGRRFEDLSLPERRLMYEFEGRETDAVAARLVRGSSCTVLWSVWKLLAGADALRRLPATRETPRPKQLAQEFQSLSDHRSALLV